MKAFWQGFWYGFSHPWIMPWSKRAKAWRQQCINNMQKGE